MLCTRSEWFTRLPIGSMKPWRATIRAWRSKKRSGIERARQGLCTMIGMVYQLTNRFEEALENYNQSLEIEKEIRRQGGRGKHSAPDRNGLPANKPFREALESYKQSLEIEKEIGDTMGEAITLHQIGIVYQLTNRFEEALESYKRSLEIEKEIGRQGGRGNDSAPDRNGLPIQIVLRKLWRATTRA